MEKDTPYKIDIYTDGAYSRSKKRGGYAALLICNGKKKIVQGYMDDSSITNNRMELYAVIYGLEAIKKKSEVKIVSDSTYVTDTINKWIFSFVDDPDRVNYDLMIRLYNLMKKQESVCAEWTRSHSGHPYNEMVNEIAQKEAGTWKGK